MTFTDLRWRQAAVWFLTITTLLRLALLSRFELAPDEAYYWDWSRRPALGYYDQGPFIAYLIRTTTAIFGTNEFGVRFGVLAASLGTLCCCYVLAARLFSPKAGFLTVLLLGLTPLMTVGSLIATYDPPMVFFWALTVVCLERALSLPSPPTPLPQGARGESPHPQPLSHKGRGETIDSPPLLLRSRFPWERGPGGEGRFWYLAGIAAGFGFLSKHTMLLVMPCLVLFLALSPRHRFWLRRFEPYLAFGIVLLMYSGVFYWNAQHHGWTFGHLLFLAKKESHTPLRRFGDFLGSQAALLGPVLFLALIGLFFPHKKSEKQNETRLFLLCMGLPVFIFFCLLTMKAKVQGNWAPCAWLTPTILWAGMLAEAKNAKGWLIGATATSGLLTLLFLSPGLRSTIGLHLPPDADLSNQTAGWRETAARVQQVREEAAREGRPAFLATNDYQFAAELAFYLPDHPETHDLFLHFRLTMYAAYVERLKSYLGEDAIFINDNESETPYLQQIFETVKWEPAYPLWRRPYYKEPIRFVHIARCRRYRRYIGLDWAEGG